MWDGFPFAYEIKRCRQFTEKNPQYFGNKPFNEIRGEITYTQLDKKTSDVKICDFSSELLTSISRFLNLNVTLTSDDNEFNSHSPQNESENERGLRLIETTNVDFVPGKFTLDYNIWENCAISPILYQYYQVSILSAKKGIGNNLFGYFNAFSFWVCILNLLYLHYI